MNKNKRLILRKENFGGLLFDREKKTSTFLDKQCFKRLEEQENPDLIVKDNPDGLTLSAPTKLFFILTRKCNLRCTHCSTDSDINADEELSYPEIENLLNQADQMGIFEIGITGGEPLCHPQFFDIIRLIKEMGFPVYLNTNGVYPPAVLKELAQAGIEILKISIDGLRKSNDRIRGGGSFEKTLASVKYLKKTNNNVKIIYTLTRQNQSDVLGMIELANELDCGIKFAPMVKMGRARQLPEKIFSIQEGKFISQQIRTFCREKHIRVPVEIFTELAAGDCSESLARADFLHTRCGVHHMHMIIDSDGRAYSTGCQIEIKKKNALGNFRNQSIAQLWKKGNVKNKELRTNRRQCKDCNIENLLINFFKDGDNEINQKLLQMLHGSRGPHGMGNLLEFASGFKLFSNSSPAPVTSTCHLWQKRVPPMLHGAEGKKLFIFRKEYFGGLLYDPKRMHLEYLDQKESQQILSDKPGNWIIHEHASDGFLSAPLKVFIGISSKCNLKCKHCVIYDPSRAFKDIEYQRVKHILRQLGDSGVLEVRLSGGEPTCRKDFFRMVEEAKKNNLTVTVNSNGVYSSEIKEAMVKSQIDRLHISLEGLETHNDYIRGKGVFNKVISSIKYMKEKGKYIRIVVCLYKDNIADIHGLIRLAEELDCDIKFSPIAKVGKAKSMDNLLDSEDCLKLKDYFDGYHSRVHVFYNFGTMVPEFRDYCQVDDFDSTVCGAGRTQLRIELSGDIYGAGCGDVDESKLPLGTVYDPIGKIWQKAQLTMLQEMNKKGGSCLDCNFPGIMSAWLDHASPSFNFGRPLGKDSSGPI